MDLNNLPIIDPVFKENYVPIVFATDNNYIPFVSVSICSIIENSSLITNYDIIILETQISTANKSILKKMVEKLPNFSIRFYNISNAIKQYQLSNVSYYTDAIYFRLFIPYIMKKYTKTIYLDCDLVVLKDLNQLYKTDIGDNYMGVVRDIGMIIYKYNKSSLQYLPQNYFQNALPGLDLDNYFNSGVLLMNLSAFRKDFSIDYLIKKTNNKYFFYPDQDGLNNICQDKKTMLPMKWNVFPYNSGTRCANYIDLYLPKKIKEEYNDSRKNPFIIHYNMLEKPWFHPCYIDNELMQYFWLYASRSPLFDKILNYKPTKLYIQKKKNKISYFERQAIVQKYKKSNPSYKLCKNDVIFCAGKFAVEKLSNVQIKFETFDILNNKAIIYASFMIGNLEYKKISRVLFVDQNEKKYPCSIVAYGTPYLFDNKAIGQKYILKATIPLNNSPKNLRVYIVMDDRHVKIENLIFSRNFPIDKIEATQYFYTKKIILTFDSIKKQLCLSPSTLKSRIKKEIKYDISLLKKHDKAARKAAFLRIPAFLIRHLLKRDIWLIGCNYLAQDNGFALFQYLQNKKKEVNCYFVVNEKNSEVETRAKKYGKTIYKYSKKYKWLFLLSKISASSIVDLRLIDPFKNNDYYRDILHQRKFVFLQHGITTQDQTREHNRFIYNPALLCTAATAEYNSFYSTKGYFYDNQVKLTGFPRFDNLTNNTKKIITIMPTWRKYLNGDYTQNTDFYKFYFALLHNERLHKVLKENGYTLVFKPHPTVYKSVDINIYKKSLNDSMFEISNKSYTETYAESNLLITDYSSAIFDFLYLGKPVIFAQFDHDKFFSGQHVYKKGYIDYKKNGFGDVTYSLDETVNAIIEYVNNNCKIKDKYLQRINEFFKWRDNNNSERVFNEIKKLH